MFPLRDGQECAAMPLTNHRIKFPIAYPGFAINNIGSFVYAYSVDYLASGELAIAPLVMFFTLLAMMLIKNAARLLVSLISALGFNPV